MMTLYAAFETAVLVGAFSLAVHHTVTRVLPLRRGLAGALRQLGRSAQLAPLQRLGDRLAPPAASGCGSGCGSCGSGCGSAAGIARPPTAAESIRLVRPGAPRD